MDVRLPPVAVIGGGHMARALIGGWLARGLAPADVHVSDPSAAQREGLLRDCPGLRIHAENAAAATSADVWVLAVKPQQLPEVARELAPQASAAAPLAISVAAGVRAADLARWLGPRAEVVRTMPNRPALVGAGVTALYAPPGVAAARREVAGRLLDAVGTTVWVDAEEQLDAVTAVSGSGPAYFFLLIELLEAAAVEQGLPPVVARRLAIDTAWGGAKLARESADDPATLRAQVTSKGGTTAAALAVLESADLRAIVSRAVAAGAARSRELAEAAGRG
ncbi:MAG: pyrroline-5-carboxylate reductase [Pseudomonadota bacterium]